MPILRYIQRVGPAVIGESDDGRVAVGLSMWLLHNVFVGVEECEQEDG